MFPTFMSGLTAALAGAALLGAALPATAQTSPSYGVTQRIKGPDGGWDYASFDPVRGRVYVSRAGGVTALDVASGLVTGHLADAQRAHAVVPINAGTQLLVTDSGVNLAHLIDAASGKLVADIPTGQKPDSAVFDPASGLVLVMNGRSGDTTLIDPTTHAVVGSIVIGGGLEAATVDGAGRLFVNIEDQNRIAVVDIKTRAVVARYPLDGCQGPTGLAYAPGADLLISACANKVAKVIRASDGAVVASLAIGAGPDQIAYDAGRKLAFIPCGRDGVMEVVAVRGPSDVAIVQTVTTQVGARTGAVDPASGKVYLPTADFVTPAAGGKPVATPGTFEILVVAPAG
jgi:DNA-binding beta-propeller fold protein YncE